MSSSKVRHRDLFSQLSLHPSGQADLGLLLCAVKADEGPLPNGTARHSPKHIECRDPATGALLGTVPCLSAAQVDS